MDQNVIVQKSGELSQKNQAIFLFDEGAGYETYIYTHFSQEMQMYMVYQVVLNERTKDDIDTQRRKQGDQVLKQKDD